MMSTVNDAASFRDPSGQVFASAGEIYRYIFPPGVDDFEAARSSGIYAQLSRDGLLVDHEEVESAINAPPGTCYCLHHSRLPWISYPWEWSFSMLKDAALLHLDLMERLLPHGFWLRDASAFNVQYDGQGLRLIDTLSIGRRVPASPWVAYRQFCAHFLAPLSLAAYCDIRTLGLWRNFIDGYPLDLAVSMLPLHKKLSPSLLLHLTMHSYVQTAADKKENVRQVAGNKKLNVSDQGLLGIIRSLRRSVERVTWNCSSKIWSDYASLRTYQSEDIVVKSEFVSNAVKKLRPKVVWDLGANTGEFSLLAAELGAFVVSIDGDAACTELLYRKLRSSSQLKNILPITMDLANPSPGLGWSNRERQSLQDRGPADMVFALALIHHLVITNCIPMRMVARWFSELAENLVVEFVPPDDSMVRKLLANRRGEHHSYDLTVFEESFGEFFLLEQRCQLQNGRSLLLYRRKVAI